MKSCSCEVCVSACSRKPGWFLPGEAEKLAENLGVSLQQLFNEKLAVDYWAAYPEDDTLVLVPTMQGQLPGRIVSWSFYGKPCTFLKDGLCSIHEKGKPYECRKLHGDEAQELSHEEVAKAWEPYQSQLRTLLEGVKS